MATVSFRMDDTLKRQTEAILDELDLVYDPHLDPLPETSGCRQWSGEVCRPADFGAKMAGNVVIATD